MSGRRRRDDGWDDSQPAGKADRRDPWADSSADEWGDGGDSGTADPWAEKPSGGGKKRSERGRGSSGGRPGDEPAGRPQTAPAVPSFQPNGSNGSDYGAQSGNYDASRRGDDRYGAGPGSGRRGGPDVSAAGGSSASGYGAPAGYNGSADRYDGDSRRDAGHGSGADRRDAGYDAGRSVAGDGYQDYGSGRGGQRGGRDAGDSDAGRGGSYAGANGGSYAGSNGTPGGSYGVNGRPGSPVQLPEFTPAGADDLDDDAQGGTPRPIGRLSIYTLHEDKTREFDEIAEQAAEGVREAEPDTLVYVIHIVPKAPMQRIMYEIYRDRAAFLSHERQPHIRQFAADRASCVLATNVIDLRLKFAKVAALGSAAEPSPQQPDWSARPADSGGSGDRYPAATQYQPVAQYPSGQSQSGQYAGSQSEPTAASASFTPAKDRSSEDSRQYAPTGRENYPPAAQYENSANGAYGAGGSQYGANGYSATANYANGGSYASANGYDSSSGYSGSNGYQGANGYSDANGYSNGSGYPGAGSYQNGASRGYSNDNGYQNGAAYSGNSAYPGNGGYSNGGAYGSGYANGGAYPNGNGYQGGNGYPGNGGYPARGSRSGGSAQPSGASYPGGSGSSYPNGGAWGPGDGQSDNGGRPGNDRQSSDDRQPGSSGAQRTPRHRELTSGESSDAETGGRYGEETRQSSRPSDWAPRSQDQR
jgi:quinol monooxygenase YgiN